MFMRVAERIFTLDVALILVRSGPDSQSPSWTSETGQTWTSQKRPEAAPPREERARLAGQPRRVGYRSWEGGREPIIIASTPDAAPIEYDRAPPRTAPASGGLCRVPRPLPEV